MGLLPGTIIAIEGGIGAGKTTLAKVLAEELGGEVMLEDADQNPFLPRFYFDPERWGLITQVTFLLLRYRQLSELRYRPLFSQALVMDYLFDRDQLFAALTLSERDYSLYLHLARGLAGELPTPDLVVFLKASPEKLFQNIVIRNRSYERSISLEYLQNLCEAYHRFFQNWDKTPLVVVNSHIYDFVSNRDHRREIVEAVLNTRSGRRYLGFDG